MHFGFNLDSYLVILFFFSLSPMYTNVKVRMDNVSPVVGICCVHLFLSLQICWCCHSCNTHGHTHSMSKGLCRVNMLVAIMPDHLIMTRPSGSRTCLSLTKQHMLITQFPNNALHCYRFISPFGLKLPTKGGAAVAVFSVWGDNWCVLRFFPSLL